jgi:aldehyde dehydrogenase (NAD+)
LTGATTATEGPGTARFPEIPDDLQCQLFIGGERMPAENGATFRCVDPYENREWGHISEASPADVDSAVQAARRAFPGWRDTPQAQRSALLVRWGELIADNVEELARLQVHENGKTIGEMRAAAQSAARVTSHYAHLAQLHHGYTIDPALPNHRAWTLHGPVGVVGAITPWNNPIGLLVPKLFPAVAVGNTVVIKPSEVTPVSTLRLVELAVAAGLPPGVVNVVTGAGRTGKALSEHPDVDKLAFTGSTNTGRAVARAGAERFAGVTLELGGKGAQIVFPDADLDRAVASVVKGITAGTGQACNAGSRVLLHESIHDEMIERVGAALAALTVGDPLDAGTALGPLASRPQLDKVTGYFGVAAAEGHRLVCGGHRSMGSPELERGLFVEPTLYAEVDNHSRLAREEIFGPVGAAITFRSEDEAVAIANDTRYGLTAGFWTADLERAHRLAPRLDSGVVWINTWRMFSAYLPFGGVKESGIGREGGLHVLDQYTETKAVYLGLSS